jgi:hypothetical protein
MTSNVSQKVYDSMSSEYHIRLDNFLQSKEKEFKKVVYSTMQNNTLLTQIESNNDTAIKAYATQINEQMMQNGINNFTIKLYSVANRDQVLRTSVVSVIQSKNSVYGMEVLSDGVFNVYLHPLIKDDAVYGVIEVKESIHNYKQYFEGVGDEYAFLLDKKMLSKISIENKNGIYRDMIDEFAIERTFYDTKFAASIVDISEKNYEQMLQEGFLIDKIYYRTYKNVIDINGANIGMIVMGEIIDKEDGFVNLADNMTKTVTTVALGLVISIMLFMF